MNLDAIRGSWKQVTALGDLAAKHFYATLFLLAPETRQMFPHSMSAQNDKLLAALGHIVSNVDRPDYAAAFAADLGADHRRFEVKAAHYAIVGQALLSTLERLLGPAWTPELSRDWQAAYKMVADRMIEGSAAAAQTQPPWWRCAVLKVTRPTVDVAVITAQADHSLAYSPGQSVPVRGSRTRAWRYLTPANAPRADGLLEFHVRAVGSASLAMVRSVDNGDWIDVGRPVGDGLALDPHRLDVLMIAGGTGLAPMCALIDAMAGQQPRPTSLVFGAATAGDLYHHHALSTLATRLPWLTYLPTVDSGSGWNGRVGTAVEIALKETRWAQAQILVCGSPAMVSATRATLRDHGVPENRISIERVSNWAYPRLAGTEGTSS